MIWKNLYDQIVTWGGTPFLVVMPQGDNMYWILYIILMVDGELIEYDAGLPLFESYEECIQEGIRNEVGHGFICLDEVIGGEKI